MIEFGREYYVDNKYFFLKKRKDSIDVYYSVNNTISEARAYDEKISFPLTMEKNVKLVVEKALKTKKKFSKSDLKKIMDKISSKNEKGEIEELVDFDGTFNSSKIPIHDPKMSPTKTMDQTVFAVSQPGNPWTRGYRVYYGESVEEIEEVDMSGAFGYEETENMDGEETFKYLVKKMGMEPDEAKERTKQKGQDPTGEKDKKSPYYKDKNFITRATLSEIQKQKAIKVLEDILTKKSKDSDIQKKDKTKSMDELPLLVRKNLKTLLKHLESNGYTKNDLIKILKNEQ
jgi:hypothetical protein